MQTKRPVRGLCVCVYAAISLLLAILIPNAKPSLFINLLISSLVVIQQNKTEVALVKVRHFFPLHDRTGFSKMASAS